MRRLSHRSRHRRGAFTLVELLVVVAIVTTLLALTALVVSSLAPSFKTTNGADLAAQWLVSARQMARRDGVPTGVRFQIDADNVCRQAVYVRQPDDVAQGVYAGCDATGTVATISGVPATVNLTQLARDGDYLELYGGGVLRRIQSVAVAPTPAPAGTYLVTVYGAPTGVPLPNVLVRDWPIPGEKVLPTPGASPTNYRIIRQPEPISGEATLKLPENVGIDFSAPSWNGTTALSTPPNNEIVFGPGGQVIGNGTKSGMIYLWVRRTERGAAAPAKPDNSVDHLAGKPILVTTYVRSGAVAQHPVSRKTDPYEFTRDGKASGM